ncbi:hypothetical protein C8R46DRAFT_1211386 [Mycena filopes]|nr:hypothetical protein C8R46DRAFT_1211386 [Mycena filopes]
MPAFESLAVFVLFRAECLQIQARSPAERTVSDTAAPPSCIVSHLAYDLSAPLVLSCVCAQWPTPPVQECKSTLCLVPSSTRLIPSATRLAALMPHIDRLALHPPTPRPLPLALHPRTHPLASRQLPRGPATSPMSDRVPAHWDVPESDVTSARTHSSPPSRASPGSRSPLAKKPAHEGGARVLPASPEFSSTDSEGGGVVPALVEPPHASLSTIAGLAQVALAPREEAGARRRSASASLNGPGLARAIFTAAAV